MSRSKISLFALVAFPLLALVASDVAADGGEDETELCDMIKSNDCPEKSMALVELPQGNGTQLLALHEPFLLEAKCVRAKSGLTCSGWPQEVGGTTNLSYEWSFEGSDAKLSYPRSHAPQRSVACNGGEKVIATLTITNGSYKASLSQRYDCATGF
jgi:hypothetical protein